MSCFYPHVAVPCGLTESGKTKYKMLPILSQADKVFEFEHVLIPCGQCIGCRLDYSREWANRMLCEYESLSQEDKANCYFVTLTYDDVHVPVSITADPDSGEAVYSQTLVKQDVSNFMKRLRKKYGNGIRFYAAGEYGDKSGRPHYHLIIYNLPLNRHDSDDLTYYKFRKNGNEIIYYFTSPSLERIWSDYSKDGFGKYSYARKGMVVVSDVCWHTFAYVARYVTKKLSGRLAQGYMDYGISPPFSLMSRRPGIGKDYYENNKDYFAAYSTLFLSDSKGARSFNIPKYFERLYEIDEPSYAEIKADRRKLNQKRLIDRLNAHPGKTLFDLLSEDELRFTERVKKPLVRHVDI